LIHRAYRPRKRTEARLANPSASLRAHEAGKSLTDPVMSPLFADLKGIPPTLLMTGTRDFFLSATANFHRALLPAGVPAELVVFDATATPISEASTSEARSRPARRSRPLATK
jgi:acetyl esterase/lipase